MAFCETATGIKVSSRNYSGSGQKVRIAITMRWGGGETHATGRVRVTVRVRGEGRRRNERGGNKSWM